MTTRAKSAVNPEQIKAFVTHNGDWDTLLVRIGHYLWRNWKKTNDKLYLEAFLCVAACKEAYRAPIRARNKANQVRAVARIGQTRLLAH